MKYLNLIALALLMTVGTVFAQTKVSGTVTAEGGEPIIGATILVKGAVPVIGAVSDVDGTYELEVPEGYNVLSFSYVGYTSQQINIDGQTTIDVTLVEGVDASEVVVTALGVSREEKSLGYAVSSLTGEEIANSNTPNMINALTGKMSGVQVTSISFLK